MSSSNSRQNDQIAIQLSSGPLVFSRYLDTSDPSAGEFGAANGDLVQTGGASDLPPTLDRFDDSPAAAHASGVSIATDIAGWGGDVSGLTSSFDSNQAAADTPADALDEPLGGATIVADVGATTPAASTESIGGSLTTEARANPGDAGAFAAASLSDVSPSFAAPAQAAGDDSLAATPAAATSTDGSADVDFESAVAPAQVPLGDVATSAAPLPDDAGGGMSIADAASKYGVTGAGVTVGILSDSFNVLHGADTMQTDIANGYLPVDTTVEVEGPSDGTDEGRAMAEVVHEIAPDASILFATGDYNQDVGMADNILQLAADGAKVIVDDIRYYDEPYYQQGVIAQAVDKVESEGVVYISSAGNFGSNGYQTNFDPGATFQYDDTTYTAADFSSNGSALSDSLLPITGNLQKAYISLQWSQPSNSASSYAGDSANGATSNLALFLTDSNGNVVDKLEATDDDIGGDAYQLISVGDDLGTGTYYLRVGVASGDSAPGNIQITAITDSTITFGDQGDNQNASTFYGHAAASGAIGVGAVDYALSPNEGVSPPISESYSSAGPDTLYYSASGEALTTPISDAVTLSGTDGIKTSFFGTNDSFFGTSAAAPSVAGVVADMLQENPTLTPTEVKDDLIKSAISTVDDNGVADPNVGGAGLVDGDEALDLAGSPPPTVETPPSGSTIDTLDPTIAGFGEAGAAIDVSIDGNLSGTTTVAASGVWTYTPATALVGGGHSVTATQTNASGVASSASSTDSFTINALTLGPAITGARADQTYDQNQTIPLFGGVVIADSNGAAQSESVTITPSTTTNGSLTDPNASTDRSTFSDGVLTLTGSTSAVTSDIDQLTFTPFFNDIDPGQVETTGFVIDVQDTAGVTASDATTSVAVTQACYVKGTRILTERGEVAIEDLRVGDLAITAGGAHRPVVWLGHRRLDLRRHPAPERVRPIRVVAGAFGDGLPRRDLWLSPWHNVASEGALIPIIALANGISVAEVDVSEVEYWHVELDAHDVIFAEGLPSESYLDTGNRTCFVNGGAFIEAHPDFVAKHWAETCLPLVQQGPEVVRTKARLLGILRARGVETTSDSDAHIVADGRRIEPTYLSATELRFVVPEGCRDIVLVSRRFTPAHVFPESGDTRELGLCVARLSIDGEERPLADDGLFEEGWREAEREESRVVRRWTAGAARLRPGSRVVLVDLAGGGFYWRCFSPVRARFAYLR